MKNLNEDLKTQNYKSVYLLFGEEDYLKIQYKNRLRQAILTEDDTMNYSYYEGKGTDVRQLIDQAETMPFFAEHRLIIVENSSFFKNASPELADYVTSIPSETILVFVESEVDKRGKLYKAVAKAGRAVELKRQDEKVLASWVLSLLKKEGKRITQDAMALLLEKAGDDMGNIANELEKLICFIGEKSGIEPADVEEICTETTENKVFDMIRAVTERRQREALDLYYDLLSLKEPPMRILFLVAKQFNQMLQLKDLREQGFDTNLIVSKSGLAPFIAKRGLAQASRFTLVELQKAVQDCVDAEEAVKTGRLGDKLAVEMVIVKYSSDN